MRADRFVQIALVLLVGALIVAGLLTAGGLETARQERRDEVRLSDLETLNVFVRCVADRANGALPERLAPDPQCSTDIRFADPFTEAPYRYTRSSSIAFQLCAGFERPDHMGKPYVTGGVFEASTGCLDLTYR